jgi:phage terminase large subunit GpA-like protein
MHKPIWAGTVLSGTKRHKHRNCFPVGVDGAKSWLFSSMNLDKGRIHFPNTEGMPQDFCDVEFFEQLCVEKRRPKYQDGRQIWYFWKPDHARNEALDTTVYALAGLEALLHAGKKLDRVPDGVPANGWITKKDVKVLETPSVPAVVSRRAEPRPPQRGAVAPVRDWLRRRQ